MLAGMFATTLPEPMMDATHPEAMPFRGDLRTTNGNGKERTKDISSAEHITDNGRTGPLVWPEMAFRNFENDPFHHLIRKEETERFGMILSSVKGSFLSQNEMMI